MVLEFFALFVLIVLIAAALAVAAFIGAAPGKVARSRNHPNAAAIDVCGWLGLLLLGPPWVIAMVWAFTSPSAGASDAALNDRIKRLEDELAQLRSQRGGASQ